MGFGCGSLLEFEWKGEGWALIRGWTLINPFLPLGWALIRGGR